MRPAMEVGHHRSNRKDSHRSSSRVARQTWVPRGSTDAVASVAHPSPLVDAAADGRHHSAPRLDVDANGSAGGRGRRRGNSAANNSAQSSHASNHFNPCIPQSRQWVESSIPKLVQEIQEKLAKSAVECMICYDMVRRSAPIWSCSSCYSIFHLNCIKKWARAPSSVDISVEKHQGVNWRCPGCQSVQLVSSKDVRYTCFCGKLFDPPSDPYLTPHSCGEPCGKPLEREIPGGGSSDEYRCPHLCVLQCHPGPCPPCSTFAPPCPCPCGKTVITRRCSDTTTAPSCGFRCGKVLECGRHLCQRVCHMGPCDLCQVMVTASCFCKKKTVVIPCREITSKGDWKEIEGFLSCDSVCGMTLSCGNHACVQNCHPGPCGDCEFMPGRIRTCCCGKTPLMGERTSCLDPIPVCSEACGKTLACGVHQCKEKCHRGNCPPCMVLVEQKCRCKSTGRVVECHKTLAESYKFLCERPCGQKKSCGRHRCRERCCPLSIASPEVSIGDQHLCLMICGKKLRCGQHVCQSLCHSGHCPPCLETIFSELSCACGRTVIPPPLPCGTPPPSCQHPCSVLQPCGHSSTHSCHFGDCPPCSIPVSKECVGGHLTLRNIPCGAKEIRCNQLCGRMRQCSIHACTKMCHPPPCDAVSECSSGTSGKKLSCGQICGAPRRDCGHICTSLCHPYSPCPDTRCDFPVTITCSCGRSTASVPCDSGGSASGEFHTVREASVYKLSGALQPVEGKGKGIPLGQRKLVCDEECAKLERKRLLADAFDITLPNLDSLSLAENAVFSELMTDLLRREPKWVTAVEERFKFLVLGKTRATSGSSVKVHIFSAAQREKRDAVKHLAERWNLVTLSAGWEPRRFLIVHATLKSKAPVRIIGAKSGAPVLSEPLPIFDPYVDMDPRLVVAFFDLPREANINALVLRFGGECELVWLNDNNALAVFSDPARAATALRRLDHASPYHGMVVAPSSPAASNTSRGLRSIKNNAAGPVNYNSFAKKTAQECTWDEPSPLPGNRRNGTLYALKGLSSKGKNSSGFISASGNKWDVLGSDLIFDSLTGSDSVRDSNGPGHEGADASSSGSKTVRDIGLVEGAEEVDDWEEAFE